MYGKVVAAPTVGGVMAAGVVTGFTALWMVVAVATVTVAVLAVCSLLPRPRRN
ncbi:MAG: hypothetical protein ACLQDY_15315 [Streptosporangiaceae bacterium]